MKKGIYSKVVEEILSKEDEILKNIGKESISVYLFLKNEYMEAQTAKSETLSTILNPPTILT